MSTDLPFPRSLPVRFHHLKAMGRSAAHARLVMDREESEAQEDRVPVLQRGTAVHSLVLGVGKRIVAYPGAVRRGKKWNAFAAANSDAEILTSTEYEKSNRMAESVAGNKMAMEVLKGQRETSITWKFLHRDCRATPDVADYSGYVTELKTCATSEPFRFTGQALRYGYHGQLAWQMDGVIASGLGKPTAAFIVAVESSAPYPVTVLRLTERALEKGRGLYSLWLERLLTCERDNLWPGYCESVVEMDVPDELELTFAEDVET